MISKNKVLYQVKVILDYLPTEEYELIPQETIDYIENNFEYDENFTLAPNIPLDEQNIDEKAFEMLDKIIKKAESNKKQKEIDQYIEQVKESNSIYDAKLENIRLKNLVELLKKENCKIPKAKALFNEYKDVLKQKDEEIQKLKKDNQDLYECIQKLPKFIRKIFIKDLMLLNQ